MHMHGQEETDENGVPMSLYPKGYDKAAQQALIKANANAKPSAKLSSTQILASPEWQASPNGDQVPNRKYVVIDLGLGSAHAINQAGDVTGYSFVSLNQIPFIYSRGIVRSIVLPQGITVTDAVSINKQGHICGVFRDANYVLHGFISTNDVLRDIGTIDQYGSIYRIDDEDRVLGYVGTGLQTGPFLYSGGSLEWLNSLGGVSDVNPVSMSNAGQMAGSFVTSEGRRHPFLYSGGILRDLGTLGGLDGYATQINENGHVAGQSSIANSSAQHVFLYSDGLMKDLGAVMQVNNSPYVQGINSLDEVVISTAFGVASKGAYLYSNGEIKDINSLLVSGSGWTIVSPNGINDSGQIAADATDSYGDMHAVLLNPLPDGALDASANVVPAQQTFGVLPVKDPTKDSLIVITHGWYCTADPRNIYPFSPPDLTWMDDMASDINSYLNSHGLNN